MKIRRKSLVGLFVVVLALGLAVRGFAQAPITFQYLYDEIGQLVKVVDSTGVVIEYVYDQMGNMLEIKRSSLSNPGGLQIFSFGPQQGGVGETVTIQGLNFSPSPPANIVKFNGTAATVTSATTNSLVVTVPAGATTGPVSVALGASTATSATNFSVVPVPVITSVKPKSAFSNKAIVLQAAGINLTGSTFSFAPAFSPPAITVATTVINPSGTSATLNLTFATTASGTFALVATNASGSSSSFLTPNNGFTVVNPNSTADSDGDGFPDVIEATLGSDPFDPNSVPVIQGPSEAESSTFSLLNSIAPPPGGNQNLKEADSLTFSLLNGTAPPPGPNPNLMETDSLTFSLLNGTGPPPINLTSQEADSLTFSLLNGVEPVPPQATFFEADSFTFSLFNAAPQASNQSPNDAGPSPLAKVAGAESANPLRRIASVVVLRRGARAPIWMASLFASRTHRDGIQTTVFVDGSGGDPGLGVGRSRARKLEERGKLFLRSVNNAMN